MSRGKGFLKERVVLLRQKGYSYELIKAKTGVSKSTLSDWLKGLAYKPNAEVRERMRRGQKKSIEASRKLRLIRVKIARKAAKEELGKISKRDLMLLGIGLYIGEGAKYEKGCIQFSNSDPKVVRLAMNWFRKVLNIDSRQFSVRIHTYPDNSVKNSLIFWARIIDIPIVQFSKTYIDKRINKSVKNRRKLPYGTVHIRIRSLGKKEYGVHLYQKILGWIELVENNNFAGIV